MNSKTPLALAIAALVLFGTAACNRNEDANGGTNNTPAATADTATNDATTAGTTADGSPTATPPMNDPAAAGTATPPSQAEALALVNVVNEHEVKTAEQAKSKKVTGEVLAYANMMQAEHSKNMTLTTALLDKNGGAPATSAAVNDQKAKGDAETQQLATLEGDAYARAYMDAMVAGHQDVLTKLDTMLIPAATDPAVKQHLETTRAAVQKHLDHAKEVQAKLGASTGATGNA